MLRDLPKSELELVVVSCVDTVMMEVGRVGLARVVTGWLVGR